MSTPTEQLAGIGHLPALDGMRAVAVLTVMGFHATIPGFHGGRAGVDVFFVISGFLITSLLLGEEARRQRINIGDFYMRRLLRLYPALVTAIVVALVLAYLKIPIFDASTRTFRETFIGVPFTLLYSLNVARAADWSSGGFLGHTWSLAIEEQFYLVWPVVVVLVLRSRSRAMLGWIALGCAISSAVLRLALDLGGVDSELLYNATFSHVDGIFGGCALAVLWYLRPDMVARAARPALGFVALGEPLRSS